MYVPRHFEMDDGVRDAFLSNLGAADLITNTSEGLLATFLPLHYEPDPDGTSPGRLRGHLARNNDQWKRPAIGEALVIARGSDSYISPTFYPAKREHGRTVPTWNYETAHIYGTLVVHDDPAWVEANVRELTERHERQEAQPWSVDDAPAPYIAGQLRAIVGVELVITRIEAKAKLNQNRSAADITGVVDGLRARGDDAGAQAVEAARPNLPS